MTATSPSGIVHLTGSSKLVRLPGSHLQAGVIRVSPSTARIWLAEYNTANRKAVDTTVERYIRTMIEKNWQLNGETIVFSETGKLLNGQHRLQACVTSKIPLEVLIVTGVKDTPEIMASFDGGLKRTGGQILAFLDYPRAVTLSAMADTVYRYENSLNLQAKVDPVTRLEVIEAHPDMQTHTEVAVRASQVFRGFPASRFAGLFHMFHMVDADKAITFAESFVGGFNLKPGAPVAALRNSAMVAASQRGNLPGPVWHAYIIKAWNATVRGDEMKLLKLSRNEPRDIDIEGLPREEVA